MEEHFFLSFVHCVMVILGLKKTDEVGTRMIRFLAGFIVYLAEPADDPATRFIENFMLFCLEHLDAKDKIVRMRLSQFLVACLNAIDELGDDVWSVFRIKMTERLFDKEASVRVHAIHAMSRLQGLTLVEENGLEVIDIFLDLLAHDPSVEVRRVALKQVDVTSKSLPIILERRHDIDNGIRRMFYAEKMKEIDLKMLTIQQRDEILQAGLSDR
jgi:condensin complex subunit 3